jgi:hypothetical protein
MAIVTSPNTWQVMLKALAGQYGQTVTLTFSGGSSVTGVYTDGGAGPDAFHAGPTDYLAGSGGEHIVPDWAEVVAIAYTPGA